MNHPKYFIIFFSILFCGTPLQAQQDLYWGNRYAGILKYDHDLDSITTVVPIPTHSPQRMVLNHQDSLIYWTDSEHRKIYQCDFDGNHQTTIISVDSGMPYGLAYDPSLDLIFYSDFENGTIYKYDISSDTSILIHDGLTSPIQLQLDTLNQDVYWLDQAESIIGKVDYLGANDSIIIDTILPFLQCFLYDFINQKIYYSDVGIDVVFIYDIQLKTSDQLSLDTIGFIREMKIDYSTNKFYWVDSRLDLIFFSNLDGSNQRILFDTNPDKKENRHYSVLTSLSLGENNDELLFLDLTLSKINKLSISTFQVDTLLNGNVYWPSSLIFLEAENRLLWSEAIHGQIYDYAIDDQTYKLIFSQTELRINGLAMDQRTNCLFFLDTYENKVYKQCENLFEEFLELEDSPNGIAIDTFDNEIYFYVSSRPSIWKANIDGSGLQRIIKNLTTGSEIILDKQNEYIYRNDGDNILRNKVSGQDQHLPDTIFTSPLGCIAGLVIDIIANNIFFVESENLISLNLENLTLDTLMSGFKCGSYNNSKMTANATNVYVNDSIGNPCDDFNECTMNTTIQYNGICGGGDTLTQDNTFMGPGDDWHEATNWSLGIIPQTCHDVIIPQPHQVQITSSSSSASCYTLDVQDGAELITYPDVVLEVLKKGDD